MLVLIIARGQLPERLFEPSVLKIMKVLVSDLYDIMGLLNKFTIYLNNQISNKCSERLSSSL